MIIDKLLINIDFDGVLIPNSCFEEKAIHNGSMQMSVDDYIKMIDTSPIAPLNIELLKFFANNINKFALRLWTNRNYNLQKRTLLNIGPFKSVFDSFHFYNGEKEKSQVEGVVIDNNPRHLRCGELGGLLYKWKGGVNAQET
jgi:hypothetical protein